MENFQQDGYGGVTETWNVIQHEVRMDTAAYNRLGMLSNTRHGWLLWVTETWNVIQH